MKVYMIRNKLDHSQFWNSKDKKYTLAALATVYNALDYQTITIDNQDEWVYFEINVYEGTPIPAYDGG